MTGQPLNLRGLVVALDGAWEQYCGWTTDVEVKMACDAPHATAADRQQKAANNLNAARLALMDHVAEVESQLRVYHKMSTAPTFTPSPSPEEPPSV